TFHRQELRSRPNLQVVALEGKGSKTELEGELWANFFSVAFQAMLTNDSDQPVTIVRADLAFEDGKWAELGQNLYAADSEWGNAFVLNDMPLRIAARDAAPLLLRLKFEGSPGEFGY